MALFGVTNNNAASPALTNVAATVKTMIQLAAATATLRRAMVYEWKIGPAGVPNATDCEVVWTVIRQTTAGTGGVTLTTKALDPADTAASGSVALGSFTAEPTGPDTDILDGLGTNQRGSYRWVVAPGGPGELIIPATNLNGIGIRAKSSNYAGQTLVGFLYRE